MKPERGTLRGWDIPGWALEQDDYVCGSIALTEAEASTGTHALELACDFPGNKWAAALVEYRKDVDAVDAVCKPIAVL